MNSVKNCCKWGDRERCDMCEGGKRIIYHVVTYDYTIFDKDQNPIKIIRPIVNSYRILKEHEKGYDTVTINDYENKVEMPKWMCKSLVSFTIKEAKEKYIKEIEEYVNELNNRIRLCKGLEE